MPTRNRRVMFADAQSRASALAAQTTSALAAHVARMRRRRRTGDDESDIEPTTGSAYCRPEVGSTRNTGLGNRPLGPNSEPTGTVGYTRASESDAVPTAGAGGWWTSCKELVTTLPKGRHFLNATIGGTVEVWRFDDPRFDIGVTYESLVQGDVVGAKTGDGAVRTALSRQVGTAPRRQSADAVTGYRDALAIRANMAPVKALAQRYERFRKEGFWK